jgi:lipopolysaccharide export system protein LptA
LFSRAAFTRASINTKIGRSLAAAVERFIGRMMHSFPWRSTNVALAAIVFAAVTSPNGASAQVDTKSKAPIDITADEAEVVNSKCLTVWRGSAEAVQAQARLRADTITVYATPKAGTNADGQPACGETQKIVAEGHVYYVTQQQNVRGDHAVYSQGDNQVVITGNVIVVQGNDVARGEKLTLNVSTRDATMESGVVGPGKHGRVRGVFYPKQDGSNPPATKQ